MTNDSEKPPSERKAGAVVPLCAERAMSVWQDQVRGMLEAHRRAMEPVAQLHEAIGKSMVSRMDLASMGLVVPMIDTTRLNAAMGFDLREHVNLGVLDTSRFALPFLKEMERLQATVTGFTRSIDFSGLTRQLAQIQASVSGLSEALRASALALQPYGDVFERLAEEEKTAGFILELGLVPHDELWDHISTEQGHDASACRADQIAVACWPRLYQNLALDAAGLLERSKAGTAVPANAGIPRCRAL